MQCFCFSFLSMKIYNNNLITHRQFYYPTQDEWYPNFVRNTVFISFYERVHNNPQGKITFHISIWGKDDHGMERFWTVPNIDRDITYLEINKFINNLPNPLNKDWLEEHEFLYI
jgi:hypothetical protein